jgi:hypothetical protein
VHSEERRAFEAAVLPVVASLDFFLSMMDEVSKDYQLLFVTCVLSLSLSSLAIAIWF